MFYVHTFQTNGHHKLGSFSALVIRDLKTLAGVKRRTENSILDTRLGYEIEQVPTSNPYAPGHIVYRSPRAIALFGKI